MDEPLSQPNPVTLRGDKTTKKKASGEGGGIDLDLRLAPPREPEQAFPDPVPGALGNPRPPFFYDQVRNSEILILFEDISFLDFKIHLVKQPGSWLDSCSL